MTSKFFLVIFSKIKIINSPIFAENMMRHQCGGELKGSRNLSMSFHLQGVKVLEDVIFFYVGKRQIRFKTLLNNIRYQIEQMRTIIYA